MPKNPLADAALFASFKSHLAEIIARRPDPAALSAPAAPPAPASVAPSPAAKSAAEREFDRVKAAALKRIAAEEAARAAEDAAVRSILDARAAAVSHLS